MITKEQKLEIEKLIPEHYDALLGFGADMYHQGLIRGAIYLAIGTISGILFFSSIAAFFKHEMKEESEEG